MHMPGPWLIENHQIVGADSRQVVAFTGAAGNNLATAHANELLIAAAPDLLEALQATAGALALCQSIIGRCIPELRAEWRDEWIPTPDGAMQASGTASAQAHNAISKATGV